MCLAQEPQRSDADEARTRGLSVSSQALYHWATALPVLTGECFCKDCNIFLCTPCQSFTNKCHLCKIIEFYKDQGCLNHKAAKAQNFQWSRMPKSQTKLSNIQTVNSLLVVTNYNTKVILSTIYHVTNLLKHFKNYLNWIMHGNLKNLNKIDVDSESS